MLNNLGNLTSSCLRYVFIGENFAWIQENFGSHRLDNFKWIEKMKSRGDILSSADDFEDELHRIAEKIKAKKPNRIKTFLKKNKWKILVAGLVTTFLMCASSVPNVGYTGTVKCDTNSAELYVKNHPCFGLS